MGHQQETTQPRDHVKKRPRRLREAGTHRAVLEAICLRKPGDPMGQVAAYLAAVKLPAGTGRARSVAEDTRTAHGKIFFQAVQDLKTINHRVRDLKDIRRVHVVALVRHWVSQECEPGTIANRVSVLRHFLVLIGKPDAIPTGAQWTAVLKAEGIDAAHVRRKRVATSSKAWTDNGVDPNEKIQQAYDDCPIVAMILEVQLALGLRGKEGWCTRFDTNDTGDALIVDKGSKGGRRRTIGLSSDPERRAYQRDVLDRAKEVARVHGERGLLKVPGLSLRQMENHYRYRVRKQGFTRGGLGVVPHGLRHEFVATEMEEATGLPPPVSARAPAEYYFDNDASHEKASLAVSEKLGHARNVDAAYRGSRFKLKQRTEKTLTGRVEALKNASAAFAVAGVSDVWLIGLAGEGLPLRGDRRLELAVRLKQDTCIDQLDVEALQSSLETMVSEPVLVLVWKGSGDPSGKKVLFRESAES